MTDYTIKIYTSTVRNVKKAAFSYTVTDKNKVLDHIRQITKEGYIRKIDSDTIEFYPAFTILKIEASGPDLNFGYQDSEIDD